MPIIDKDKLYVEHQEGERKDIERAFSVLRHRFSILKRPAHLYDRDQLNDVVLACIILHNMIGEDEKEENIEENLDLNVVPSSTTIEEPEFSPDQYVTSFDRVLEKDSDIRDRSAHFQLKKDLVKHIWNKCGPTRNISGV
jgi:hypothetical protein